MPSASISSTPRPLAKGTALHRQVFLVLRDQIGQGVFHAGEALPKEEALCERFGVSRITIRRALADLSAQGFVERRQGVGTFVPQDLPKPRERASLSFVEGLRKTAAETQVTVLSVEQAMAPSEVARLLQVPPSTQALHALRLRSIAGTPVMLIDAWLPQAFARRITANALRKHALYEILIAQGVDLGRVVQEITAVAADRMQAEALDSEVGSPLLKLARLMHGRDARPIACLDIYLCPERSRILMDIPGSKIDTLGAGQVVHDQHSVS